MPKGQVLRHGSPSPRQREQVTARNIRIEIQAERNPGDKRTGKLFLIGGGKEQEITVTQADGHFSVGDPIVSGSLKAGVESAASLEVKWDKAFGGENISIAAQLSGASEGLSIQTLTETKIEKEGNGSLSVSYTHLTLPTTRTV